MTVFSQWQIPPCTETQANQEGKPTQTFIKIKKKKLWWRSPTPHLKNTHVLIYLASFLTCSGKSPAGGRQATSPFLSSVDGRFSVQNTGQTSHICLSWIICYGVLVLLPLWNIALYLISIGAAAYTKSCKIWDSSLCPVRISQLLEHPASWRERWYPVLRRQLMRKLGPVT